MWTLIWIFYENFNICNENNLCNVFQKVVKLGI